MSGFELSVRIRFSDTYTTPCLIKARRKMRPGERMDFGPGLEGEMLPPCS